MARSIARHAARIDAATPTERDRYVDLLRAVAIGAVVLGHWLVVTVFTRDDGRLDGDSVLTVADWTHWLTWLFQVMPVFFLVGGYANATSWQRHADRGGDWPSWVHRRSLRLLGPTAAFVGLGVAAVVAARLAGADPGLVDLAGWVAGIMLWFLAVYVLVAALTPLTHRWHERSGVRVLVALAAVVVTGDLARVVTGDARWATVNFLLGWALIHQVGYWWRDGALPSGGPVPPLLALGSLVALVSLVLLGPWPVAMVDLPGAPVQNSSPPSLALLALASLQMAVVLAVAEAARNVLRRPLPWATVVAVNRVVLSLFLWHMAAVPVAALVLYGTGLLPDVAPLTPAWFAWRPVWVAVLALLTAVPTLLLAPLESRAGRPVPTGEPRPRLAAVLIFLGVPLACAGLVQLTLGGLAGDGPLGIPVAGLGTFAAGMALTTSAGRYDQPPSPQRAWEGARG